MAFGALCLLCSAVPVLATAAESDERISTSSLSDSAPTTPSGAEVNSDAEGDLAQEAQPPDSVQAPAPDELRSGTEPTEQGEALERDSSLETPAAAAERRESQSAYAELSPSASEELLEATFPEQLLAIDADPSRALSEVSLEKVLSPTEALVSVEGEEALLESATPL